ncbi:MAG: hypothetical protein U0Q22_03640 [Acidimicrobiales bacterium]
MTFNPHPLSAPCSCPSTAEIFSSAIEGVDLVPTCQLHQADAIAEHKAAQRRDTAERAVVDLDLALARVRSINAADVAEVAKAREAAEREQQLDELSSVNQLCGTLARAVGAPMASMPLNESGDVIAANLGLSA